MWVVAFSALLTLAAMILPSVLQRAVQLAFDDVRLLEAQILAANLKEVTKYLILYEKVIYSGENALLGGGSDPLMIDNNIRNVWRQSYAEVTPANMGLLGACGGYGMGGRYYGTHRLGGLKVFCPLYFRTNLLGGIAAEKMLFDQWSSAMGNQVVNRDAPGQYTLVLNFSNALDVAPSKLFPLNYGQRLLAERARRNLRAEARVTFYTDSSGFRSVASERYVNITVRVRFLATKGNQRFVEDSESLMITLSTPKDFALFVPYPPNGRNFTANFDFRPASDVKVYGRTFFDGDINLAPGDLNVALEALPEFHDTVVISGNFTPQVPGPDQMPVLRRKFKKGIVTHFSAGRFVKDGRCGGAVDAVTDIQNQSQMHCWDPGNPLTPGSLTSYLANTNDVCSSGTIDVNDGGILHAGGSPVDGKCHFADGTWVSSVEAGNRTGVSGGFARINVNTKVAFVFSPTAAFESTVANATINGIVFGGQIRTLGRTDFRSIASLKVGDPGASNEATLSEVNQQAGNAIQGVNVPLLNMPVVYSGSEGMR